MYFTKRSSIVCETKPCCVGETLFEVKGPGLIPFVTFSSKKRHVHLCTAIRCVQSHLFSLVLNTDSQLLSPFLPLAFGPEHTLLSYSNRTECRAAQVPMESRFSFNRATMTSIGLFTREHSVWLWDFWIQKYEDYLVAPGATRDLRTPSWWPAQSLACAGFRTLSQGCGIKTSATCLLSGRVRVCPFCELQPFIGLQAAVGVGSTYLTH